MSLFGGICGNCGWSYFVNGITDEDWDAYMRRYEEAQTPTSPLVLLLISVNSSPPNATQRKRLVQFLEDNPQKVEQIRASAFVMDSRVARASLTAMGWLIHKPYPEKVFTDPKDALDWLATISPACKPSAVLADIAGHVPTISGKLPHLQALGE